MSTHSATSGLTFPSGRTVSRIRQDSKRSKTSLDELASANGIYLPWRQSIDYLKDKHHLDIKGNNVISGNLEFASVLPPPGMTSFVVGDYNAHITRTANSLTMIAAKIFPAMPIGYSDFSIAHKNGIPKAINLQRSNTDDKRCGAYLDELEALENTWRKTQVFLKDNAKSFTSAKIPSKTGLGTTEPSLLVAINPRKFAFSYITQRQGLARSVIFDNQVADIMCLGSGAHWEQFSGSKMAQQRRDVLSRTHVVQHQKGVQIADKSILLVSSVSLSDDQRNAFADTYHPMREVMTNVVSSMPSWEECATKLRDTGKLEDADFDEVIEKITVKGAAATLSAAAT